MLSSFASTYYFIPILLKDPPYATAQAASVLGQRDFVSPYIACLVNRVILNIIIFCFNTANLKTKNSAIDNISADANEENIAD